MKYSIFNNSEELQSTVAKALGYKLKEKNNWFLTQDMYFESYFYLCNRFGNPEIVDDYKKRMIWDFNVKSYTIRIVINSSWVSFIIFGDYKLLKNETAYEVKFVREYRKNENEIIPFGFEYKDLNAYQKENLDRLLKEFCKENNINSALTDNQKFDFLNKNVSEYNDMILNVDKDKYLSFGNHLNSKKKHALRTLRQFINNMLTPIWVRDCAFNIKGRVTDEQVRKLLRYENNIKINIEK